MNKSNNGLANSFKQFEVREREREKGRARENE